MSKEISRLQQDSGDSVTERILALIGEQEGVSPIEFDQPLYDVIEPDALDALFHSDKFDGKVEFTYLNYEIIVFSDGTVNLTPLDG